MKNLNEKIANAIGKKLNVKIWKDKRLYIAGYGYNTKKCKQNIYICLENFTVHCFTDCPSQSAQWCQSQSEAVIPGLQKYARLARLIAHVENKSKTAEILVEEIEMANHNEELNSQQVVGFTAHWQEVRVAINSYGKLAFRNRQFLNLISTTKNSAPKNFTELSEEDFSKLKNFFGDKEIMLDPYQSAAEKIEWTLNFVTFQKETSKKIVEEIEQKKIDDVKKIEEQKEKVLELTSKLETMDSSQILSAWKNAGCPQPCPAIVAEFKIISGLSWKAFRDTIK